jgi:hypothetical protein
VFSYIEKSRQHKLSPKAIEGVFVGYASDCHAWLVYNPTTRSITRIDSAVFNEQWKPVQHNQVQKSPSDVSIKTTRSSSKVQPITPSPVFPSKSVNVECTPDATESCVLRLSAMHPTFSLDIKRISQIPDSTERQDYVLNFFEKMENADVDPKDYYEQVTDANAQAQALRESPEVQACLSEVTLTDDVVVCQEIVVPRAYA